MTETVGFIGLGVMGAPMARNLLRAGLDVVVTTTSETKARAFSELGATVASSPADMAARTKLIFTCVPDNSALVGILQGGAGVLSRAWPGGLLVDCSTIAPFEARAAAQLLDETGASLMDAPVSGGKKGAEDGTLTIMCGGEEADFKRASFALEAMGKTIRHVGAVGAGQTIKSCNQIMVAINLLAACEAIGLARANGVDPRTMREIVMAGTGRSFMLEANALRYLDGITAPGFRIDLLKKDIGIANAIGAHAGTVQPATALAHQLISMASNIGLGDLDTSGLGVLYERLNARKPEAQSA
jgi:3-hydroxyisobutyrate dehydrogenase-like beta-hydroxyacid dehydrogenase